ncbi:PREDICTED: aminopeptidase N-like, partial [Charadrius vociferus]|uniref:aminopeptidase N-like n=1 Tax=Charadrius vociferus TaxID=50402 RepID=UPI0005213EA4
MAWQFAAQDASGHTCFLCDEMFVHSHLCPPPPPPVGCRSSVVEGAGTRQELINGEKWNVTQFETTPKMSTYLLAFIVSQFDYVEKTSEDVLIRIWGRPKAIAEGQGNYALQVTGPILSFFERHYNTSYPLPKSDQVGLPDFNAGAMENWGLVTYRENSL